MAYKLGHELLDELAKTIDFPTLEAEFSKINGIVSKRFEKIMSVIEKFLKE